MFVDENKKLVVRSCRLRLRREKLGKIGTGRETKFVLRSLDLAGLVAAEPSTVVQLHQMVCG